MDPGGFFDAQTHSMESDRSAGGQQFLGLEGARSERSLTRVDRIQGPHRPCDEDNRMRAQATPECSQCPSRLECLAHCGFKDGNPQAGQFCIETQLAAAQRGNIQQGLFFRGSESVPFGTEIRKVRELLEYLLTGQCGMRTSESGK